MTITLHLHGNTKNHLKPLQGIWWGQQETKMCDNNLNFEASEKPSPKGGNSVENIIWG